MNLLKNISILVCCLELIGCSPNNETLNHETLKVIQQTGKVLKNNIRIYETESKIQNSAIQDIFETDPVKIFPYKKKADSIHIETSILINWILQIENDSCKTSLNEINLRLRKYQDFIIKSVPPRSRTEIEKKSLSIKPLDPTSLLVIQNEIIIIKYQAIRELYGNIDVCSFRFDTLSLRILAESKIVPVGREYRADIFLSPFSATSNPHIYIGEYDSSLKMIGNYDSIPINRGIGTYSLKPKTIGNYELKGVVQLKNPVDPNTFYRFPFKTKYEVVK